jgi:hypothetical protein
MKQHTLAAPAFRPECSLGVDANGSAMDPQQLTVDREVFYSWPPRRLGLGKLKKNGNTNFTGD